jgi:hypothetical protein
MDRSALMGYTTQQSLQTAVRPMAFPHRLTDSMQAVRHAGSSGDVGTFREIMHDYPFDVALISPIVGILLSS